MILITTTIATEARKQKEAEGQDEEEDDEDEDVDKDTASRFVARLLRFLFNGCKSKDKVTRFRVVQCIAEMVAHLGEVTYVHWLVMALKLAQLKRSNKTYEALRACLLERIRDKENPVRVQAAIALSKLCGSDSPEEEPKVTDVMIDVLIHDTSA